MFKRFFLITLLFGFCQTVLAAEASSDLNLHLTGAFPGILALIIFCLAYLLVMTEEMTQLRKSKPVLLSAGLIWVIVSWQAEIRGLGAQAEAAVLDNLLEYAEILLFLLVAMTYINALEERQVFKALRVWLVQKGFSYRQLFWITGFMAFFISPFADNLTTALLMCAVVMAVGGHDMRFVSLSCINIVVAANAGGAFSPFGDLTTLMVWQKGIIDFHSFFVIFLPSLVSYLVPAALMSFCIPKNKPSGDVEKINMRFGAKRIILLFLFTIATAVIFHQLLDLPSVIGMMMGLSYLTFFAYYIKWRELSIHKKNNHQGEYQPYDIFNRFQAAEWDTLLFFYGVILSVGGLATLGYLEYLSTFMYTELGAQLSQAFQATPANFLIGIFSSIIDNIPIMYAVLTMNPDMSQGQWLLATLTAGIGGSLLSIGSAAGVALMGASNGHYTFLKHLKWTWAIFLGYCLAVLVHIMVNHALFYIPV